MRYILIFILALFLFSCDSCDIPAQDHLYKIVWDYNNNDSLYLDSTNIVKTDDYVLYGVDDNNDTLNTPFIEGQLTLPSSQYYIGTYDHDSLYIIDQDSAVVYRLSAKNGKWVSYILFARGINSNMQLVNSGGSNVAHYKKDDTRRPDNPKFLRVYE